MEVGLTISMHRSSPAAAMYSPSQLNLTFLTSSLDVKEIQFSLREPKQRTHV